MNRINYKLKMELESLYATVMDTCIITKDWPLAEEILKRHKKLQINPSPDMITSMIKISCSWDLPTGGLFWAFNRLAEYDDTIQNYQDEIAHEVALLEDGGQDGEMDVGFGGVDERNNMSRSRRRDFVIDSKPYNALLRMACRNPQRKVDFDIAKMVFDLAKERKGVFLSSKALKEYYTRSFRFDKMKESFEALCLLRSRFVPSNNAKVGRRKVSRGGTGRGDSTSSSLISESERSKRREEQTMSYIGEDVRSEEMEGWRGNRVSSVCNPVPFWPLFHRTFQLGLFYEIAFFKKNIEERKWRDAQIDLEELKRRFNVSDERLQRAWEGKDVGGEEIQIQNENENENEMNIMDTLENAVNLTKD